MLCLSGFELYSRWVPLNCVYVPVEKCLKLYKTTLHAASHKCWLYTEVLGVTPTNCVSHKN